MKKIILPVAISALMAISCTSFAQSQRTPEQQQTKEKFETYRAKLNLTDEQAQKVKAIDSVYVLGLAELKNSSDSKLSKFRKFKDLSSTRDKQMKSVLNKDQFEQYKQFKAEMKEEFKANRNN